jgi:hypothetical protein
MNAADRVPGSPWKTIGPRKPRASSTVCCGKIFDAQSWKDWSTGTGRSRSSRVMRI